MSTVTMTSDDLHAMMQRIFDLARRFAVARGDDEIEGCDSIIYDVTDGSVKAYGGCWYAGDSSPTTFSVNIPTEALFDDAIADRYIAEETERRIKGEQREAERQATLEAQSRGRLMARDRAEFLRLQAIFGTKEEQA